MKARSFPSSILVCFFFYVSSALSAIKTLEIRGIVYMDSTLTAPSHILYGEPGGGGTQIAKAYNGQTTYWGGDFQDITFLLSQGGNAVIEYSYIGGPQTSGVRPVTPSVLKGISALHVNNVFGFVWNGTTYVVLSFNQGGFGETGTDGIVRALAVAPNSGDVYVGGQFNSAGGYPGCVNIGCYSPTSGFSPSIGWQTYYFFSAYDIVDQLAFDIPGEPYALRVRGITSPFLTEVEGPINNWDPTDYITPTPNNRAKWNTNQGYFGYSFWTAF